MLDLLDLVLGDFAGKPESTRDLFSTVFLL